MRQYLEEMNSANYISPRPEKPVRGVHTTLPRKMLEVSSEQTSGPHTYFVAPLHAHRARQILGTEALLAPEQGLILEQRPSKARELARNHMSFYLALPNYVNDLRELGFTDNDLQGGRSDRLVDAIVAWGDSDEIRKRIQDHFDAGAGHVAVQQIVPRVSLALIR